METKKSMTGKLALKAEQLALTEREISSITDHLEKLKEIKTKLEAELLEVMQSEDVTKFSVDKVGTVFLKTTFYPKVIGDPEIAIRTLDELGYPEASPRTVNAARLREIINMRQEEDESPLPEEIFRATPITKVHILKVRS